MAFASKLSNWRLVLLSLVFVPTLALSQDRPWGSLAVFQGIRAGLWEGQFIMIPPNPRFPASAETGCITRAEIETRMSDLILKSTTQPNRQDCTVTVLRNFNDEAVIKGYCPPIPVPSTGVTIPAIEAHVEIRKSSGMERWEMKMIGDAIATSRLTRLGACPALSRAPKARN